MPHHRPRPARALSPDERAVLLRDYVAHYAEVARADQAALNRKIPREEFAELFDRVIPMLREHAAGVASVPGPVREFLDANPLPAPLAGLLPDDVRAYCLALYAVKQWLAAEQGAMDKYLLGADARELCLATTTSCMVTGEPFGSGKVELHHPVRDGRPPIPLSKAGHARLERQTKPPADDLSVKIKAILKSRSRSVDNLRKGCLDLLGHAVDHGTPKVRNASLSVARKVADETKLDLAAVLAWAEARKAAWG